MRTRLGVYKESGRGRSAEPTRTAQRAIRCRSRPATVSLSNAYGGDATHRLRSNNFILTESQAKPDGGHPAMHTLNLPARAGYSTAAATLPC